MDDPEGGYHSVTFIGSTTKGLTIYHDHAMARETGQCFIT